MYFRAFFSGPHVTIRTANAIAQGGEPRLGAVIVSTALVPHVADGTMIRWTNAYGSRVASGAIGGTRVTLSSGECVTVTDEPMGRRQSVFNCQYATEHWRLYRQLRGTGRWLHDDRFPTREACGDAADRQHGLGRAAVCRFQTGRPETPARIVGR